MRTTRSLLDFAVEAVSQLAAPMPANHLAATAPGSDRGNGRRSVVVGTFTPTGMLGAETRIPDVTLAMLIDVDAVLA